MYLVILVSVLLSISHVVQSEPNNVCPTFDDYYTIRNNSKCWYDFSAEFDAPTVIKLNGYKVIEYKVQTQDGYILTMYRIPSDNVRNPNAKRHPIYLQHGLVSTCAIFIALKKNSLAFVLADAGYDVWLGNYRGSEYSEGHVNMTVLDNQYWEQTMDDIAIYDFPAMFSAILKHSPPNSQIIYIGHSLGTTLSLMYAAEFPETAQKIIKMMVLISPAYTLTNMKSPYRLAAPFGTAIVNTARELELFRIVSQAAPLRQAVRQVCLESPPLMRACLQLYNLFYGPNTQMGPEIIPVYFNQLPGGTALKILNHAADMVLGNFRKYDYLKDNYKYYGTPTPPIYDIRKIHLPVYLIYSAQDWATTEKDAWNLWYNLPKDSRFAIRKIDLPKFNHIDFVYGRHVRSIVYDDLVRVLNKVIDS